MLNTYFGFFTEGFRDKLIDLKTVFFLSYIDENSILGFGWVGISLSSLTTRSTYGDKDLSHWDSVWQSVNLGVWVSGSPGVLESRSPGVLNPYIQKAKKFAESAPQSKIFCRKSA